MYTLIYVGWGPNSKETKMKVLFLVSAIFKKTHLFANSATKQVITHKKYLEMNLLFLDNQPIPKSNPKEA